MNGGIDYLSSNRVPTYMRMALIAKAAKVQDSRTGEEEIRR